MLIDQQTDTRIASIEVKVKKLDGELARYKDQMSKLRNGPGKVTRPRSSCSQVDLNFPHRTPYNNELSEL